MAIPSTVEDLSNDTYSIQLDVDHTRQIYFDMAITVPLAVSIHKKGVPRFEIQFEVSRELMKQDIDVKGYLRNRSIELYEHALKKEGYEAN